MSLLRKLTKLASTPQGQELVRKAKRAAQDPANQQRLREMSDRAKRAVQDTTGRRRPGDPTPPPRQESP